MSSNHPFLVLSILGSLAMSLLAQTHLRSSQVIPMTAPLVPGLGTTLQINADGSGQVNVSRPVRTITAAGPILVSDCHSFVITSGLNVALPTSAVPGFANGCEVFIRNTGAAIMLSGGLSRPVAQNVTCSLDFDGTNWQIENC